jgi:hypothetical protein
MDYMHVVITVYAIPLRPGMSCAVYNPQIHKVITVWLSDTIFGKSISGRYPIRIRSNRVRLLEGLGSSHAAGKLGKTGHR